MASTTPLPPGVIYDVTTVIARLYRFVYLVSTRHRTLDIHPKTPIGVSTPAIFRVYPVRKQWSYNAMAGDPWRVAMRCEAEVGLLAVHVDGSMASPRAVWARRASYLTFCGRGGLQGEPTNKKPKLRSLGSFGGCVSPDSRQPVIRPVLRDLRIEQGCVHQFHRAIVEGDVGLEVMAGEFGNADGG